MPTLSVLPSYLAQNAYMMPTDYDASPMRWATGQSQFEWLEERPGQQARFNALMASRREGQARWFDIYPVERLLRSIPSFEDGAAKKDENVFMIDIGGNEGHDLLWFLERYPYFRGRLILQDLPTVVARNEIQLERKGIEVMGYSFFDQQPVKGTSTLFQYTILSLVSKADCTQGHSSTTSAPSSTTGRTVCACRSCRIQFAPWVRIHGFSSSTLSCPTWTPPFFKHPWISR